MARILVIEDEAKLRRVVALHLTAAGHEVVEAASAEDAAVASAEANLVLTDLRLPGADGLQVLAQIKAAQPRLPVIVMTAYGTIEVAVAAMKQGAADFLLKPFSLDHLSAVVAKAIEVQALRAENESLRQELGVRYQFDNLVGHSQAMREIFATLERVAPTRATVLLAGESGVGKDMIARAIHHHSPRAAKPFVKINCTAIPENLMESELFGYEKGAFTGAVQTKPGKFEQADGGTVFLDEIGDVPASVQVKLLRILQEREFERLGSNRTRRIDVRVIAATNVDLREALEEGRFREDLYYRLNVVPLNIPPLRERKEDIPYLAEHLVARLARELASPVRSLSPAAVDRLAAYHWPGNVRELQNVLERSLVLCSGETLDAADLRFDTARRPAPPAAGHFVPDGMTLDEYEQSILREALKRAGGNKSQAARLLGLTRNALRYRLSQMGIDS